MIEVLITVVILALVMTLALPRYHEQMARAKRSDAQVLLLSGVQYMQAWYAGNNSFEGMSLASAPLKRSPATGIANYNLELTELGHVSYTLKAVRTRQGPMANDRCGDLTYDHLGRKGLTGQAPGVTVADCWR